MAIYENLDEAAMNIVDGLIDGCVSRIIWWSLQLLDSSRFEELKYSAAMSLQLRRETYCLVGSEDRSSVINQKLFVVDRKI